MKDLDIKELWNQSEEKYGFEQSEDTINRLIAQPPKDLVHRFISMLTIEMWLNVAVFLALSIALSMKSSWYWFIGINAVSSLIYFYYKGMIRKLNNQVIDTDVLDYLKKSQGIIQQFLLHYKATIWVVTLPAFCFGLYWRDNTIFESWRTVSTQFYLTIGLGFAAAIIFGYVILYFWYGKKANRIQDMISSLADEESL